MPDGSYAFGSRIERGLISQLTINPEERNEWIKECGSLISVICGLDFLIANEDRHFGNFLFLNGANSMQLISYSQNLEDIILWRALKDVKNGFYVDVGAAWPDTDSVTKLFYDKGWFGINIEPNPEFYARLCEQRPRDINLRIAVCDRNGEGNLNLFSDTGLSTLDAEVAKEHVKNKFDCVSINVTTATLSSLFQRFLPKKQEINFLKIDVEGLEAEVLASNNWLLYRPWIIVVESTLPLSQVECQQTWEPRLLAASYTFAYADGLNRFYIENVHLGLR